MILLRWLPDHWKEKLRRRAGAVTPLDRLENLRRAGFRPRQVIDAGAYRGDWARLARKAFPDAALLLIEAQPQLEPELLAVCAELSNARLRRTLLGRTAHSVPFVLSETNSRIVDSTFVPMTGERVIELPVEPLASAVAAEGFGRAELLKLDLQGHELEALAGAGELFGNAEVIVTEVSWLQIGNVPLVSEVMSTFLARHYRPYDIWGFNYRPRDRALWQTDLVFVREDSPLLASRSWS